MRVSAKGGNASIFQNYGFIIFLSFGVVCIMHLEKYTLIMELKEKGCKNVLQKSPLHRSVQGANANQNKITQNFRFAINVVIICAFHAHKMCVKVDGVDCVGHKMSGGPQR